MSKKKLPKIQVLPPTEPTDFKNAVSVIPADFEKEHDFMLKNGLTESIMGWGANSMGTQLSQSTTMFKTLRWYMISNMRQLLSQVYVEIGLVQTLIDVPVDDGLRGGVNIKSKILSSEELEKLHTYIEREDLIASVSGQALKWNRLYGGAGILILTDQDPETPFDINAVTEDSPLQFRAVDMWELFYDKQDVEGFDPELQMSNFEFYNYYAKKVHKSRVMRLKGITPPSFVRPRLRGWGFSVIEALIRSINQYFKATDLTFEVLDEFKIDVYKLKNLANTLLAPGGGTKTRERVALMNQLKNYLNAVVLDSEDEFEQKELSFTGLAETMQQIRLQVASDLRMPLSKLFGIAATGFSSGEDDIENYNAMVESQVRAKIKFDILRMAEIVCQKLFGMVPEDLTCEFKPMRILSAEQEENVKTQKFNRVLAAKTAGVINDHQFADACNKDGLLPIQLDTDMYDLNADPREDVTQDANSEDSENPKAPAPAGNKKRQAKTAKEAE